LNFLKREPFLLPSIVSALPLFLAYLMLIFEK
jgi:hypothetical protein